VADTVLERVEALKGHLIPEDVEVTVTRHYGHTAAEKSNELLLHMGIAVFSVSLLILFALGWRESLVVALAIPPPSPSPCWSSCSPGTRSTGSPCSR
jgi:multidrug efflux pump subunit AcrB